jgi:rubrerythrin
MSNLSTIEEILDFAIASEQGATTLYTELAAKAKSTAVKEMFEEFAAEERKHKVKLEGVRAGKQFLSSGEDKVLDLQLSAFMPDEELTPEADYQSALIFVMKREKEAFKLYTYLAGKTDTPEIKELLLGLAQEEAKHKLRFELEYDEFILVDN